MSRAVLIAKKICKTYKSRTGNIKVLDKVDFQVHRGELLAVCGRSGSGKSTLLNILSTAIRADSGSVYVDNYDLEALTNRQRAKYRSLHIGYIPQNLYLLEDRNVFANIALPLQYAKVPKREIREIVEATSEKLGICSLLSKPTDYLSRGERQRVAICRAIVKKPAILFADEPSGSLDKDNELLLVNLFQQLATKNVAIIVATHDNTVSDKCDTVFTM